MVATGLNTYIFRTHSLLESELEHGAVTSRLLVDNTTYFLYNRDPGPGGKKTPRRKRSAHCTVNTKENIGTITIDTLYYVTANHH